LALSAEAFFALSRHIGIVSFSSKEKERRKKGKAFKLTEEVAKAMTRFE